MSKNNLFKLLFVTLFAFAATAFTGCSDDNDELTTAPVLVATPTSLSFGEEGGTRQIAIEANCAWTVNASTLEGWADVTPLSGEGSGTLTVTTYESTAAHQGVITFSLIHEYYGKWGKAETSIAVKQTVGNIPDPVGDALYEENCGTSVSKVDGYWPYVTAYEGWQRGGTLDQSGVTYGGTSSSVRNSGADYDDNTVSGAPYISVKTLEISKVNIASNTNFTFQFVAQNTVSTLSESPFTPSFGDITASSFKFEVGVNGTWHPVEFSVMALGGSAAWHQCTAMFKLPADVQTGELAFRWSGFTGGSNLRVDDLKLYEGGNGAELGGGNTPDPGKEGTISAITSEGTYTVDEAVVAATYKNGFLMEDETGAILVYQQVKDGPAFTVPAVGTKLSVSGNVTTYGGMLQFSNNADNSLTITEKGTGSVQQRTPVVLDAAAADALKNATKPSYIKYTGTLTVSGNYYNVAIPGATIIGSLQYPNDNLNAASFAGKSIDVVGWHVGCASNGKYLNTMVVTLVEEGGGENPDPGPDPTDGTTFDFSAMGYTNATELPATLEKDGYKLTLDKGGNSNGPKWYDSGSAVRFYANNTLTVTGGTLKSIELVFGSVEYDWNKITTNVPTYAEPKWTGEATSVTFTVDGVRGEQSSDAGKQGGNRRIVKVIINGGEGGGEQPTEPKVTTAAYKDLTAESVTLGGSFEGFTAAPAEAGVEYLLFATGTVNDLNWATATKVKAASAASPFTVAVTGLTAESQYAYRAYAGDVYGEPMTFVTPAAGSSETWETVAEALAAGNHSVKATVVGVNNVSVMLADNTGKILVYLGKTPSVAVGDVVTAVGDVELRYGLYQFKNTTVLTTVESGAYTQPAPVEYDGAKLDAFYNAPAYDYVTFKGTLACVASGNYTNYYVTVAGTSTVAAAQIYRPLAAMETELKAMDGKTVTVTGYMCGTTLVSSSQTKYSNVMALSVVADGEQGGGDEPDPTGKSVALTAADIAKIGGSYADFSLTAADGSAWSGYGMLSSGFLQLGWNTDTTKNASKCYVLTPEVSGAITTITITPDSANKTYNDRVFVALPADFVYTGQSVDEVKAAAYAYSANTVQGSTDPLTIDLKGKNLKQVVIRAVGGACYVADIKVEFE